MEDLTPGYRFYPTEEELVSFYLRNMLEAKREDLNRIMNGVIPVVDIYDFNPWELPQLAGELCRKDQDQWFFFTPRQESEARGGRPKRLAISGYWKASGTPNYVYSSNNRIIGLKRTMVFYNGRAPRGTKTDWKMNEYKASETEFSFSTSASSTPPKLRNEFCLCRIYRQKSKCSRDFDRRPPPQDDKIVCPDTQQLQPDPQQSRQAPPMAVETRTASPESSSSADGNQDFQTGETSNSMTMVVEDEPMWDWDQLDWLWK